MLNAKKVLDSINILNNIVSFIVILLPKKNVFLTLLLWLNKLQSLSLNPRQAGHLLISGPF